MVLKANRCLEPGHANALCVYTVSGYRLVVVNSVESYPPTLDDVTVWDMLIRRRFEEARGTMRYGPELAAR